MITALILDLLRICGLPNDQPQDHARRGWCPECRWNYGRGQWHLGWCEPCKRFHTCCPHCDVALQFDCCHCGQALPLSCTSEACPACCQRLRDGD